MFNQNPSRIASFAWIFVANLLFALIFMVCAFGYNTYTRTISFTAGFSKLANAMGGLPSFLALVGMAALAALVVWVIKRIADSPDFDNIWAGAAGLVFVVLALFIGNTWLDMPNGIGFVIVGFIALVALQTALAEPLLDGFRLPRFRRRAGSRRY